MLDSYSCLCERSLKPTSLIEVLFLMDLTWIYRNIFLTCDQIDWRPKCLQVSEALTASSSRILWVLLTVAIFLVNIATLCIVIKSSALILPGHSVCMTYVVWHQLGSYTLSMIVWVKECRNGLLSVQLQITIGIWFLCVQFCLVTD